MNTNIRNEIISSNSITKRKQDHIDVCRQGSSHTIENRAPCGFESLQFIHTALPELAFDEISTKIEFLGKTLNLPLFISCMTGGSAEGYQANRALAESAQTMGIPIGLGSLRLLLTHPERIDDFSIRSLAPDVPIMGNIGAVQLRDESLDQIKKLVQLLQLDALVVHLNCGQELFQKGGDRDFRGLKKAIAQAVNYFNLPIIVKETGFGIRPQLAQELIAMGVAYIDIAGSGGTNWILVEKSCDATTNEVAAEFANWGNETAVLLDATAHLHGKILASGGLRSGMDLAKSLALGAVAGGMALPFIRSALEGGSAAVCEQIHNYHEVLQNVMLLTGCKTIADLRKTALLKSASFAHSVATLQAIDL